MGRPALQALLVQREIRVPPASLVALDLPDRPGKWAQLVIQVLKDLQDLQVLPGLLEKEVFLGFLVQPDSRVQREVRVSSASSHI